jgi:hypothetical protein
LNLRTAAWCNSKGYHDKYGRLSKHLIYIARMS